MALAKITSYLDTSINIIAEQEVPSLNKLTDIQETNRFLKVLQQIYILIKESQDGEQLEKILEAISYLERVHTINFFRQSKALGLNLMDENLEHYHLKHELSNQGVAEVANKRTKMLISLHQALAYYYLLLKAVPEKSSWEHCYSADQADSQIMNEAIKYWQNMYGLNFNKQGNALLDFKRDFTIEGMIFNKQYTDKEIIQLIENMVGGIKCSEKQKDLLKDWLLKNGGQDINRFIHFMFMYSFFSSTPFTPGIAKALEQHWYVKNNKVCMSCDIYIKTLQQGIDNCMFMKSNPASLGGDQACISSDFENLLEKNVDTLKPLMRFKAEIELDIEHLTITPKVKKLAITSYTHLLSIQKEINEVDQLQLLSVSRVHTMSM